jgi:hypothetical protein
MPNGNVNADGTAESTTATNLADYNQLEQWGGVIIHRAYVEYDLFDHLTLRAGHWLTPHGIWNIDHGSPAIVATQRPYTIGEQLFPEHQTGLDLFGSHRFGEYELDFHLTASNGRGGAEAQEDLDSKLAFGGRLELVTPWGLRVGGSYYRGRFTDLQTSTTAPPDTYREVSYAGDVQYDHGPLHLQGELLQHRATHYGAEVDSPDALAIGGRDEIGGYALASWHFTHLWNVTPYAYYEEFHPDDHTLYSRVRDAWAGLNFRPAPSLVLKLQSGAARFAGDGILAGEAVLITSAQVAWVF